MVRDVSVFKVSDGLYLVCGVSLSEPIVELRLGLVIVDVGQSCKENVVGQAIHAGVIRVENVTPERLCLYTETFFDVASRILQGFLCLVVKIRDHRQGYCVTRKVCRSTGCECKDYNEEYQCRKYCSPDSVTPSSTYIGHNFTGTSLDFPAQSRSVGVTASNIANGAKLPENNCNVHEASGSGEYSHDNKQKNGVWITYAN
mmetsp:Transcript_39873/g.48580  ORF Transcript_39873/g.48580 Transcript_39873/m.48580 type:complete len:201 (+) Transcript_39873:163-765(+)